MPLKELILYSHRISGTVAAPEHWTYNETLPVAFRPPAPHEHEIRSTLLFSTESQTRASKPEVQISKYADCYQISMSAEPNAQIRYTLDSSIPSVFSGKVYQNPFEVPIEADFFIKAIAVLPGMKESEVRVVSVKDTAFSKPRVAEMMAERPEHIVVNRGPQLDFGVDISPYSSKHSSDEDNEFNSPFLTFTR